MNRLSAVGVVALAVAPAIAGPVTVQLIDPSTNVHSGWQATVFDDNLVSVVTDYVDVQNDVVVIEKFAEFVGLNSFGTPDAINIVFQQVLPDAQTVSRIAITDETVINSTGKAWIAFEMFTIDSGQVAFDPAASAGFDISPFTVAQYSAGNTKLHLEGGVVPAGGVWTPGQAAGQLVMQTSLASNDPVTFTLKELPVIPSPGSLALLSLAGLCTLGRSRRR